MRVKRGTSHVKRRKNLLSKTKGYKWGRKNLIKRASEAVIHAGVHAYTGRKLKKRTNRGLWNISVSAAVKQHGTSYSQFIGALKKHNIELNRKVLSQIAREYPVAFESLIKDVTKK